MKITRAQLLKFFPAAAFVAGLGWDSLTMTRIDRLFDNIFLLGYLVILGGMIILTNFIEKGLIRNNLLLRFKKWYPFAIQFFLGGLFSGYTVFYFQSASLTKASLFFLIIAVMLIINEFLEKKYTNLYLQISLYFLANLSFFIFFIPVIFSTMGLHTFIIAGIISLIIVEGIVYLFQKKDIYGHYRQLIASRMIPFLLFFIIAFFYSMNWIPPVPLSLKFSGMYHNAVKVTDEPGRLMYELEYRKPPWYKPWQKSDEVIYQNTSGKAYCFSAVFASTDLKTSIYHHWMRYSDSDEEWLTTDEIKCDIRGGREEGYRGYSFKEKLVSGYWRVDIRTESYQLLGRLEFEISDEEIEDFEVKKILK
ncbi:DUF2914 domain-containing protein [candidate division KSB1 bacterium]